MNTFFFKIQQISENSTFFSDFQIDQNYYLFFYGQNYPWIHILEELTIKQRKIRFLYVLEIMEFEDMSSNGKDLQILTTNLKPSFWRNLKTIFGQNKKALKVYF